MLRSALARDVAEPPTPPSWQERQPPCSMRAALRRMCLEVALLSLQIETSWAEAVVCGIAVVAALLLQLLCFAAFTPSSVDGGHKGNLDCS